MSKETLCLICGEEAVHQFWCPCDLTHALCEAHKDWGQKDCAWARSHPEYLPKVRCELADCDRAYHGAKHPHSMVPA